MKFLIDRCAGVRLARWLRDRGHDVAESRERGADPGDAELLRWAASERRVLVTLDKDFGELIFTQEVAHCGLVRLPDVPADRRIELFDRLLSVHPTELAEGAVVTIRGGRIRISR